MEEEKMRIGTLTNRALHIGIIFCALSIPATAAEYGPENGHLVIVGGSMRDPAILERFIELAGGPDVPFVVIPTAGGGEHYDQYWTGLRSFKEAGVKDITVLHTKDRTVADSEEFVKPIREARGVWFSGGRQWRLVDSYSDTLTHKELHALLERGGVIGGSSAGATIQGSYLARGDTKTNTIMMGDHEEGMAFLRQTAIDQHLLMRNRHFDLIEVIEAHPDLLGIGLDENTAIVVSGDSFSVIGQGYVAIYDHQRLLDSGGKFYFLAPGDRFNMSTRQAMRRTMSEAPFSRVQKKGWKEK
jgi:cyanophycinase